MASPAVLSPVSSKFPVTSTDVSATLEDEAPFAQELPHVEAYADHRVQKDLPHNHKTDYPDHPVKHPHHKVVADLKKTSGAASSDSTPSDDLQSSFQRVATFARELPHVEAYEDHRVQKDLPHNHKTDHLNHPVKHSHPKSTAAAKPVSEVVATKKSSVDDLQSTFQRVATFARELPHVEAYEDHRVQKDLPHNHKTDYANHPVKHPHHKIVADLKKTSEATTSESTSSDDLQSTFQRVATFARELPHIEAYEDHRVQKDLPHNHKTDYPVHPPKHAHDKKDSSVHPPMVLPSEQK